MADEPVTRASKPASSPPAGKGKGKQVMGLPLWMWGVGAVVLVGGYLYMRHSSASSASSQQKPAGSGQPVAVIGSPTGLSLEQFLLLLQDMQGGHGKGKGHGHHGGGHHGKQPNPGGPERRWLIKKTGSQHPWTFLAQHHERIVIGPHGTRTIVKQRGHK